jgi:hypothetical protein
MLLIDLTKPRNLRHQYFLTQTKHKQTNQIRINKLQQRQRYLPGPPLSDVIASDDFLDVTLTYRHETVSYFINFIFLDKPNPQTQTNLVTHNLTPKIKIIINVKYETTPTPTEQNVKLNQKNYNSHTIQSQK